MKIKVPVIDTAFKLGILLLMLKVLMMVSNILTLTNFWDEVLSFLAVACLMVSILSKRFERKTLLIYIGIILLALITTISVRSTSILLSIIACLSLKGEDTEETVRIIFFYETVFVAFNAILSVLLIPFGYDMLSVAGDEIKWNFGFSHPNVFSILLINLSCMWLWINYDRIKVRNIAVILIVNLWLNIFTGCRTALVVVFVVCALVLVFSRYPRHQKILSTITAYIFPILSIMMCVFICLYSKEIKLISFVDRILTTRIKLGAYGLEYYGFSVFGQDMTEMNVVWDDFWRLNDHTFDNIYSFFMINYGIVWILIISVLCFLAARRGTARNNIFILAWALYGMTEANTINPFLLFPILLIVPSITDMHNETESMHSMRNAEYRLK